MRSFGYVGLDWHDYVELDQRYLRPTEVDYLLADPTKAITELGWEPRIFFKDLVRVMVDADVELLGMKSPGAGRKNSGRASWKMASLGGSDYQHGIIIHVPHHQDPKEMMKNATKITSIFLSTGNCATAIGGHGADCIFGKACSGFWIDHHVHP